MIATKKNTGFTIIELMLVIAIIGLLATFAYPAYQKYIIRTKRSDAKVALAALQQAQEKYRANHPTYSSSVIGSSTSPKGYYDLAVVPGSATATGYLLKATAKGEQAIDTACIRFFLDNNQNQSAQQYTGGSYSTASEECWK